LVHDSRGIEIVNFTTAAALSAGTLMASAGTLYRLVPAHFYPCRCLQLQKTPKPQMTENDSQMRQIPKRETANES